MNKFIYTVGVIGTFVIVSFVLALLYVTFGKKHRDKYTGQTKAAVAIICIVLITLLIIAWL